MYARLRSYPLSVLSLMVPILNTKMMMTTPTTTPDRTPATLFSCPMQLINLPILAPALSICVLTSIVRVV